MPSIYRTIQMGWGIQGIKCEPDTCDVGMQPLLRVQCQITCAYLPMICLPTTDLITQLGHQSFQA